MPDPKGALLVLRGRELGLRDRVRLRGLRRERDEGFGDAEAAASEQGSAAEAAAKRQAAAAYGHKRGINLALARLSKRFRARGWVKAAAARIFKKAFQRASGRSLMMNFDIPDPESIKGSYLQKTLISLGKLLEI